MDEVWCVCFRRPRPGWRVLGRFLEPGCFVGFHAYHREDLAGKKYQAAGEAMIAEWKEVFGDAEPLRAEKPEDYLTGLCIDVGKKEDL